VMAHAQKPDFIFRRNGRVHLNRQGASVQSTTSSRGVGISGSNAGYTKFRGSVKCTGYPLPSPISPSLLPCVTVCQHISTGLYLPVLNSIRQFPLHFSSRVSPCAITFQLDSTFWSLTPFANFLFTSPPVRHRLPSHFNWTLPSGP